MTNMWICSDCERKIIPPLGKPFDNGDGKIRCAACAVDKYMTDARVYGRTILTERIPATAIIIWNETP